MKTNHLMLRELLDSYHPKKRGFLSKEEYELINETLCLNEMNIVALRNLRDYTVVSMARSEKMEDLDRISAITHCIDLKIIELGGEV